MIKKPEEIEIIAKGGKILSDILDELISLAKPGVTTQELDDLAEKRMLQHGGVPAFKGYRDREEDIPFPSTICASVNHELVHTPASNYKLKEGDIFTIDVGIRYPAKDGFFTDMAKTIAIGKISTENQKLLDVTKKSMDKGIAAAKLGNLVSDIGETVQTYVEKQGYAVVRSLVGHGVGYEVHEEPRVPNYVNPKFPKVELKEGMVLAIEPMVNVGSYEIKTLDDGWTVATADDKLCAHFEHTVAITKKGPRILTQ